MTEIIPNRIKEIRELKGMTRQQLAEKAKVSISHLAHLETHSKPVTTRTAILISNALGVRFKDIFLD